jgi:hypothetical protein
MNQLNGAGIDFPDPEQPSTLAAQLAAMGIYPTLFSQKTTDQSVTSSTVLVDCAGLSLPVEANSTYLVKMGLLVTENGGSLDAIVVAPSGATAYGFWSVITGASPWGFVPGDTSVTTEATIALSLSAASRYVPAEFLLVTGATAGTVKLQFAQSSSNASASTTKSGSWIKAQKL